MSLYGSVPIRSLIRQLVDPSVSLKQTPPLPSPPPCADVSLARPAFVLSPATIHNHLRLVIINRLVHSSKSFVSRVFFSPVFIAVYFFSCFDGRFCLILIHFALSARPRLRTDRTDDALFPKKKKHFSEIAKEEKR